MRTILFLLLSVSLSAQTKYRVCFKNSTVEFSDENKAVIYCGGICDSIHTFTIDYTETQAYKDSVELSDNNFALATIIQTAKSAEGVAYNQLTASQVRALVAILLFKEKAINPKTLAIRPLTTWIK